MAFNSAYCDTLPIANDKLTRFDGRYWHLDFPLSAISTIVADTPDELTVNCEFRSNRNLTGLLWSSYDKNGHPLLQYMTDYDYRGVKFAFAANPLDPYSFSLTATVNGAPYIFRLYPYKLNGGTLVPDVKSVESDGAGPNTVYSATSLFPNGTPSLPDGYQYYVIDFDDLRTGYSFDGAKIDASNISEFFISITPSLYGLGNTTRVASVGSMDYYRDGEVTVSDTENVEYYHLKNVDPRVRLSKGDILQLTLIVADQYKGMTHAGLFSKHPKPIYTYKAETFEIEIDEWTGDGTTDRYIKIGSTLENVVWFGGRVQHIKMNKDTALGSESVMFNMRGMSVTGNRSVIGKRTYNAAAHDMQMTSGYDDTYNITPWRQVDTTYRLGYRGHFDMYMGMSHFFKASSYGGNTNFVNKVIKDATEPLNYPTEQWCKSLFKHLVSYGYTFVWSTSFEILASYMPEEWAQRDYSGAMALSGWSPPSSFVIPAHTSPLDYLARVIKHGLRLMKEAGMVQLLFQIGEPWWWDGSYTNGAPCIYDQYTRNLYKQETGNDVPTPFIENYSNPVTDEQRPYLEWIGHKLGQATNYIRDAVKTAYPESKATLLFFTPQIMNPASEMLPIINFPMSEWVYPNYDFVQIEDYDWISGGQLQYLPLTIEAATVKLKYPLEVVHYFVGFVNTARETWVWPNINIATKLAFQNKIPNVYIWAYPQVIRDGITYDNTEFGTDKAIMPELTRGRQMPVEIEKGVIRPVYLVQCGQDIFLNSSDKDIQYNGKRWIAAASFGKLEELSELTKDENTGFKMSMSCIPLDQLDYTVDYLRSAKITVYGALFDADHYLIADPRRIAAGYATSYTVDVNGNTLTIGVSVLSKLTNLHKAKSTKYTDAYQTTLHPDDRGFQFVSSLKDISIRWGSA